MEVKRARIHIYRRKLSTFKILRKKKKMLTHIIMSIHDVHKFYNGPENISSSV